MTRPRQRGLELTTLSPILTHHTPLLQQRLETRNVVEVGEDRQMGMHRWDHGEEDGDGSSGMDSLRGLSPPREKPQGSCHPRSRGRKEDNLESSTQRTPKSKSTPTTRAAKPGQANWERTKGYNEVLGHWHQNTVIILNLLDFSLFMSLFLVLLVLTLNDTEQKKRDMFSKMTPTFINTELLYEGSRADIFQCSILVFIQSSKAIV